MPPSASLLPHFSNLPEIAFFHDRPIFFPVQPFHRPKCSSTLISTGESLFCSFHTYSFYSNHISSANTHPISAFLKLPSFGLHFSSVIRDFFQLFRDAIHLDTPFPIRSRSTCLKYLSDFPLFLSADASRRRFSLFAHRPDVSLGAGNVKALYSLSFHPPRTRPLRLTNPFSTFSLPSTTLPVCPQQICTLLYTHLRRVERFMRLSRRCYACVAHIHQRAERM